MDNLNKFKDEIHKCSKCGLCQSVCPVYKATGNDCAVSRGKFIMLNGVIKGDLELNKNVNKYLDMCLKCNACKNFCPSGIDARKIFTTAKAEYFNKSRSSIFIKILNSSAVFDLFLNFIKVAVSIYRYLCFDKLVRKFYPIFQKMGWLGKKAILANEFITNEGKKARRQEGKQSDKSTLPSSCPPALNTVYFKGCVNEYINPRAQIATENILNKIGVNIINADLACCGVPFLSAGNIEQFIKQAEYNLAQIPDDFDYFLTDCASCQNAFKEYENYINDEKTLEKLKKINEKSINVVDFVLKHTKHFEFSTAETPKQNLNQNSRLGLPTQQYQTDNALASSQKISFTFHKPCHLENMDFLQAFLEKAKNIEYREMQEFDTCCGFSGAFAAINPEISTAISAKKAQNAINTNSDYIVTSCPACVLGLKQGLIENNKQADVINFIELVAMSELDLNSNYQNGDCKKELFDNFIN